MSKKYWDCFVTWHPVGDCGALHIRSLSTDAEEEFENALHKAADGRVSLRFESLSGVMFGPEALEAVLDLLKDLNNGQA